MKKKRKRKVENVGTEESRGYLRKCGCIFIGLVCENCEIYGATKGPPTRDRAPFQIYHVGIDGEQTLLSHFLLHQGVVVVVVDYLTKWPEAFSPLNHEAKAVVEELVDQFWTHFGLSDDKADSLKAKSSVRAVS